MAENSLQVFHSVDAKHAKNIGEQSVSSHIQAITELVKNAYDADATHCKVHFFAERIFGEYPDLRKIIVEDDAIGMTYEDIVDKWMRVGTSFKVQEKSSPKFARRVVGDKGMGHFAAQKLGDVIEITTTPEFYDGRPKSKYKNSILHLKVNWKDYEEGKDFNKIPNRLEIYEKNKDSKFGTRIIISSLKDNWSFTDLEKVTVNLGTLMAPEMIRRSTKHPFEIDIIPHGFDMKTKIESVVEKYAPFKMKCKLRGSKVNYSVYLTKKDGTQIQKDIKGYNANSFFTVGKNPLGDADIFITGYYDRAKDWLPNTVKRVREIDQQLEENSGIRIFNDGIRIMPYGSVGNDWADLDAITYKRLSEFFRNRNIIGFVSLTREKNPNIKETTTREGLVDNEAFRKLKEIVQQCIRELVPFREAQKKERKDKQPTRNPAAVASSATNTLEEFLEKILRGEEKEKATNLTSQIKKGIEEHEKKTNEEIEEAVSLETMYRNLASLGISSLSFHHEVVSKLGISHENEELLLKKWDVYDSSEKKSIVYDNHVMLETLLDLSTYVKEFASLFKGAGGARRKKEKIDLVDSITRMNERLTHLLGERKIKLEVIQGPQSLDQIFMNRASWESIVLNMVANSIRALFEVERSQKIIRVSFEKTPNHLKVRFFDNGKGIAEDDYERLFQPFWTTYKDIENPGTGMGATIIREIVEEDYEGEVKVEKSILERENKGKGETTFLVSIPLENLSGE